jgi:hypothetical protein
MAIPEACGLWIEQRVKEELQRRGDTGASLREIGRQVASEVEKYFETKVNPGTIFQRARRLENDTNVSEEEKEIKTSTCPEIKEIKHPPAKDGTFRGGFREGAGRKPKEKPEPEQDNMEDCLPENPNIITFDASDEDQWREIGEKMSQKIDAGEIKPRVGSTVSTAVKKALKKGVVQEPKPIDNFDRGAKHGSAFAEFLTFWADGTIKPESEEEAISAKIARDCLPTIIVQASRLGVNIMAIYEMFIDPNRREQKNDRKEITQ